MEWHRKNIRNFLRYLVAAEILFTVLLICCNWLYLTPPTSKDILRVKFFSDDLSLLDDFDQTFPDSPYKYETLTWVVKLRFLNVNSNNSKDDLNILANSVAENLGLKNLGQVGQLPQHFLFAHSWHEPGLVWPGYATKDAKNIGRYWHRNLTFIKKWSKIKHAVNESLTIHPDILSFDQQTAMRRVKRYEVSGDGSSEKRRNLTRRNYYNFNPMGFNDPLYHKQWHLENQLHIHQDMNITGVWLRNITGRGITVAVIDDGLDWRSEDIKPNYNPEGSFDVVSNDDDPSPSNLKDTNHHGTRCAGEIAAVANNSFCGVGVAWGARVSGIRLIDGPMTDEAEARAFTEKLLVNDIYSCSWGPEDDGKTLDGPRKLALKGLRLGTDYGRNGYGSIYVVASGNGGRKGDNCNFDGYANSIYTVTIGAVDEFGEMPAYSEECASMLAVAHSSGFERGRGVVTSDWSLYGGSGCTENHSGTSAAAPLAAGIIALMLEARPCLTWRDVQYIIAVSAVKIDINKSVWTRNAAGLHHSHQHGFGIMDAWRLVNAARVWQSIPWITTFTSETNHTKVEIMSGFKVTCQLNVQKNDLDPVGLKTLEYVHLMLTLTHEVRGEVEVGLVCPSGTSSVLGATRMLDNSNEGFKGWIFSTVRCWGEEGHGLWQLVVIDHGIQNSTKVRGHIIHWKLLLYGSSLTSDEVAERIRLVETASSGEYLNSSFSLPCGPPPVKTKMENYISEKYLKILILIGTFAIIMALFDTVEYAACYKEEKKEHSRLLGLTGLARSLSIGKHGGEDEQAESEVTLPLLPLGYSLGQRDDESERNLKEVRDSCNIEIDTCLNGDDFIQIGMGDGSGGAGTEDKNQSFIPRHHRMSIENNGNCGGSDNGDIQLYHLETRSPEISSSLKDPHVRQKHSCISCPNDSYSNNNNNNNNSSSNNNNSDRSNNDDTDKSRKINSNMGKLINRLKVSLTSKLCHVDNGNRNISAKVPSEKSLLLSSAIYDDDDDDVDDDDDDNNGGRDNGIGDGDNFSKLLSIK